MISVERKRTHVDSLTQRMVAGAFALLVIMGSVHAGQAWAQGAARTAIDYPAKPIRVVVPSSVGGGLDILIRIIGPVMTESWGRQIIVDNRAGAGGLIGSEIVARSAPDGYTLLMVAGGYTLNPSLYAKLPYDTIRDFERVTLIAFAPNLLVVHASIPVHSVKELIAFARARPNFLTYASSGVGTASYLSAEIFKRMTGVEMVHVPYKGGGDSNAAAVAGQVHLIFSAPNAMIPHVKSGRVRSLGVTSSRRLPVIPDVPTIAEAGLPGFDVSGGFGMLAPAHTPKQIITKLNTEIVRILRLPGIRNQIEALGFDIVANTPEEYTAYAKADMAMWAKALKEAGIMPEQ